MKTAFRTVGVGLIALAVVLLGALTLAPSASATQQQTVTIVWQMPSWDGNSATWPQTYVSHAANVGLGIETPDCGYFQVDVYKYGTDSDKAKVDALIAGGVLKGPNNPPEPLISGGIGVAWKFVNAGECETTSPSPSDSSGSPSPSPSESSSTPTPTPSGSSDTPTPTPTTDTPTPTPTQTTTQPGTPTPTPTTTHPENGGCTPTPDTPCTLPRTGSSGPLLPGAIGLILAGAAALFLTRRKGTHA